MSPKCHSQRHYQLALFREATQAPAWTSLTEEQKRVVRRVLCRMLQEAAGRPAIVAMTREDGHE